MLDVNADQVEWARKVLNRARSVWLARANVMGMDVSFRQKDSELTQEIAIRVYVCRKRPLSELRREERFPEAEDGVRVDAIEFAPD